MGGPETQPAHPTLPPADEKQAQGVPRAVSMKTPRKHVTLSALGHEFAYLGDNDYIHSGYRADYTWTDCFWRSVLLRVMWLIRCVMLVQGWPRVDALFPLPAHWRAACFTSTTKP